ncbi:echinoidin-like [Ptychodera flava]|uniref:echinoidin-like n=1 Tax=Ptychodera flava TaxID=63121 RepID=UPI003969EB9A
MEECVNDDCNCMVYKVFCQQDTTVRPYQQKAAEFCSTLSIQPGGPPGRLASLRTLAIDNAIRGHITSNGMDTSSCIPKYGFWIGLRDGATEGEYFWSDGGALCPFDFRNWAPGEPNNNTKKNTEDGQDCVQLWFRFGHGGLWDDEYCDFRPKGIICEIPDPFCHSKP